MAAFEPLDISKPVSNKQLAEMQNRLHDCLHSVGDRVDDLTTVVREDRHRAVNWRMEQGERMARLEGALGVKLPSQAAMDAGERPKPVSRKLAGLGPWQAGFGLMGAMAGAAGLYKIIEPVVIAAAVALRHALLTL